MTNPGTTRLRDAVISSLSSLSGRDPATIIDATTLDELGLDSLDITAVLLEIETILDEHLPVEALAEAAEVQSSITVSGFVDALSSTVSPS